MEWFEPTKGPPKLMDVQNPTLDDEDDNELDFEPRRGRNHEGINRNLKRRIEFMLSSFDYNDASNIHEKSHPTFSHREPCVSSDDFFYPRRRNTLIQPDEESNVQKTNYETLDLSLITQENANLSLIYSTPPSNDHNISSARNDQEPNISYHSNIEQRINQSQRQQQAIIARNPETGSLYAKSPTVNNNNNDSTSWAQVTNGGLFPTTISEETKKKKKKTKKTKSSKTKESKKSPSGKNDNNNSSSQNKCSENPTNSIFPNEWGIIMNDNNNNTNKPTDDKNNKSNAANDKSKKNKRKLSISNNTNQKKKKNKNKVMEENRNTKVVPELDEKIFKIVGEQYGFKNAGTSSESLDFFYNYVKDVGVVCWSIIYYDENCTTPFVPFTKKYCTEKTASSCTHWNCTADCHVRAIQASQPLLGAMFVLHTDDEEENEFDCFLLPLGRTLNPFIDITRMAKWPIIPIQCETSIGECWDIFRKILCNQDIVCVTYNATVGLMPYHYHCKHDNITARQKEPRNVWDLKLASWMLSPHAPEETLEFDTKCDGFSHLRPKHHNIHILEQQQEYSSQLKGLLQIQRNLEFLSVIYPIIQKSLEMQELISSFQDIESPVLSLLSAMECHGIRLKSDGLYEAESELQIKIDHLIQEARTITNSDTLLLSSSKQIQELLFDKMQISIPTTTNNSSNKHQSRSSSEEVLLAIQKEAEEKNQPRYKIIDIILEFRKRNKMITGFLRPLPHFSRKAALVESEVKRRTKKKKQIYSHVNETDVNEIRMIHPMWMQTAVRTGRLSCRKPNMQQIPNNGEMKTKLRSAFIPSSNKYCFVSCDYSQNEVRILAHVSNDMSLISMFQDKKGIDIYKQMASLVTGVDVDNITKEQRATYKQVTLAIIYGMGIAQVAQKLGIQKKSAQDLYNSFYRRFPRVKMWIDETKKFAHRHKYVKTIYGRKRYLDDIDSHDTAKKAQAERQAVNTIIQGSAADLMKLAMLKMASRIADWAGETKSNNTDKSMAPKMLLQIHDELLFETAKTKDDIQLLHASIMRCCGEECVEELELKVPLKLQCSVGNNWGEMQDTEDYISTL